MIELPRLQKLAEGLIKEDFRTNLERANLRAQELQSFLSRVGIEGMLSEGDEYTEAAVQISTRTKWPTVVNVGLSGHYQVVETTIGGLFKFSREMRTVQEVAKYIDRLLVR